MRCPYCGTTEDKVIDSRPSKEGGSVRRRRECTSCERRFTTYEYVEEIQLQVLKNDGSVEPFERGKLVSSVLVSLKKRPVTMETIDEEVAEIIGDLFALASKEVTSVQIGESVMKHLKKLDKVAYIRYASVYRNFERVGEFTVEVRKLS